MFDAKKQEKKRQPKFSKIHISETKAHLQRSRDTCLMDRNLNVMLEAFRL